MGPLEAALTSVFIISAHAACMTWHVHVEKGCCGLLLHYYL